MLTDSMVRLSGGGAVTVTVPATSLRVRPFPAPIESPPCTMRLERGGLLRTPSSKVRPVVMSGSIWPRMIVEAAVTRVITWSVPGAIVCASNGVCASRTTPTVKPVGRTSGTNSSAPAAAVTVPASDTSVI